MAYCTNCGSILPNNANFCHVCGTKVEVSDTFDKNGLFEEPKKEEPRFEQTQYRGYYEEFNTNTSRTVEAAPVNNKKSFIPGLIGMIGSVAIGIEAFLTYLIGYVVYTNATNTSTEELRQSVASLLSTVASYLFLAAVLGGVLGGVGIAQAKKGNSKKGMVFSIIAVSVACICLGFAIYALVERGTIV